MTSEPATSNPQTARILVIEDDSMISMLLEDMLETLGYIVAGQAARVEEALEAARNTAFDLAILDVDIAGKSCEPIAQALDARKIPFVFATGYGTHGLPDAFRDRPTLKKPFQLDGLSQTLASVLSGGGK
jgi:DNA-binding NtrC family response regulator